ncbi:MULTISPECIES: hypothetical protein [Olivibacter]|uniref:Uncharacterized protein n=1 Tax=Olivibacter jilunii TaxID=985016 RepID=A0ABW6AZW1_9SPHI
MNQENKQTGSRYRLFEHMVDEYGLHLLDSQIDDIALIAAEINGINSLREELEKWKYDKKEVADRMFELKLHVSRLKAENQKLREALEYLIENNMCSIKGDEIAKEALKGVNNE